jgi:hypothetical protein
MAKSDYSQKEEDTFRKDLFRRMDGQDEVLKVIKDQTIKTNGRVTVLEVTVKDYTDLQKTVQALAGWKMWLSGAVAVILLAGGVYVKLLLKDIYRTVNEQTQAIVNSQKEDIAREVVAELERKYELQIK